MLVSVGRRALRAGIKTIHGKQAALNTSEYDALPEQAFYVVGPIEEVVQKAQKLAEEHS